MFEDKESFWKKRGFYISACALLVAIMAVGIVYYRQAGTDSNDKLLANIATEVPEPTQTPQTEQKPAQTDAGVSNGVPNNDTIGGTSNSSISGQRTEETVKSTAKPETKKKKKSAKKKKAADKKQQAATVSSSAVTHSFSEEMGLLWPVKGDVILKYSTSSTVYFKTLAQYRCNPGVVIAAKEGSKVKAAADCRVTKIEKNEELGTMVTVDIGNNYTLTYGQLDNISVNRGDELKEGDVIGTVAAPTKYYTEEGSNLYFQVNEGKKTVDPLLLLR